MMTKPMGYKSPFLKRSSPMQWQQLAMAAAPGVISAIGSMFGSGRRRKEQREARQEMAEARKAYMDIQFTNPLAGIQNPYAENVYEDLTVDTQAADYLREQQQQSQANIMQQMKGVAGGSGVAGLAQQMANIGTSQARQASVQIAQQERQNQMARLRGEQQKQKGAFDIDIAQRQAQQKYVTDREIKRKEQLWGAGIDRLSAADQARATARGQFVSGLGMAAAGVAGHYAPGGVGFGTFGDDMFKLRSNIQNWGYQKGLWDLNK